MADNFSASETIDGVDFLPVDGSRPATSLPFSLLSKIRAACPDVGGVLGEAPSASIDEVLALLAKSGLASLLAQIMPFSRSSLSHALRLATMHDHADCLKELLRADPPFEYLNLPLRLASELGHLECASLLAPRVPALECRPALSAAAGHGRLDVLSTLIARLSSPTEDPSFPASLGPLFELGYTQALEEAALHGHVECARLLAPLSNPKLDGSLALRWAASAGFAEIVELLIPLSDPGAHDWTALSWAIDSGRDSCVDLLLPLFQPSESIPDFKALALIAERDGMALAASFLWAHAEALEISKTTALPSAPPPQGKPRL